jgi:hypothetical protein
MVDQQSQTDPRTAPADAKPQTRGDVEQGATARLAPERRSFGQPSASRGVSDVAPMLPLAVGEMGLKLITKRTQALSDYWGELSTANANYWSRFLSDYMSAVGGQEKQDLGAAERPLRPH